METGTELETPNKEGLPLSTLPPKVIARMLEKLYYDEFCEMEETCQLVARICGSFRFFPFKEADNIYVNSKKIIVAFREYYDYRLLYNPWYLVTKGSASIQSKVITFTCSIKSSRLARILELLKRNKARAEIIVFQKEVTLNSEELKYLFLTLNATQFEYEWYISKNYFLEDTFKNITILDIGWTDFEDYDLLKMNLEGILDCRNDLITGRVLNHLLKQWQRNKIEIGSLVIEFSSVLNSRTSTAILEGVTVNPVWTPALHNHSIISNINLADYRPDYTGSQYEIYVMWRSDDIKNVKALLLDKKLFHFAPTDVDEKKLLFDELDYDQYHAITNNMCYYCHKESCSHRRRYPTCRLKRKFPILWKSLMISVKFGRYLCAAGYILHIHRDY